MTPRVIEAFRKALMARGYDSAWMAPHGSMNFSDEFLQATELGELMETLVARREKVFNSVAVVGQAIARESYDDVVAAIEATKEVISMTSS